MTNEINTNIKCCYSTCKRALLLIGNDIVEITVQITTRVQFSTKWDDGCHVVVDTVLEVGLL